MRLFSKWLICCAALLLAWVLFPGGVWFAWPGMIILGAGTVLWLVNLVIRPVAQVVSIPITLLTFGLFSIVVNALMVRLTDWIVPGMYIRSFWICVFIALMISVGNALFAYKGRVKPV
ncbi:phage holin family protein [Papillibacter cinnamivorans]|uniref:Putative membrane protein n=1 Tax=Papillibacter cinnamivorans DSM 12816 TaxID=1122930 RepID=A0A1W2CA22_9FIRM|nr:phage holin family protein [Papillibacter cinnamivorans]SMC81971.1 putative membrane protein [Papillibacter cinnamivorans DSM 12816]